MHKIAFLKNPIQEYAWGSHTAIPTLLGHPAPSPAPQAELWMGAHPKAPSTAVYEDGTEMELSRLIKADPEGSLGRESVKRFGPELPYLFKVLAAAAPLSIQAHPDGRSARIGFEREQAQGIALDAPHRNYKDPHHKPECVCALTRFWGLNGFREPDAIRSLAGPVWPRDYRILLKSLEKSDKNEALRRFFQTLMGLEKREQAALAEQVRRAAEKQADADGAHEWIARLSHAYPGDPGVLAPLFLNLIALEPGQAMFLGPGQLHAYLEGTAIELMANSDNVLRGGLTPKHVDLPELLKILRFEPIAPARLSPVSAGEQEAVYETPAAEFLLSVIQMAGERGRFAVSSAEILLCLEGAGAIRGADLSLAFGRGDCLWVPAGTGSYALEGNFTVYKSSVPRK